MNSWRASPYTLAFSAVVIFGYISTWISSEWVDLVSANLSKFFFFHRFLTFSFITDEIVVLVFTLLAVFMYDKLTKDAWGLLEMCIFYSIVNFLSVVSSLTCCYFWTLLFDPMFAFTRFNGCSAFICGVLMVSRQFDSDRLLVGFKNLGLKSRYGLWLGLLFYVICVVFGSVRFSSLLLYTWGFISSWVYLRFFQRHPFGKYGDHRPCFSFARLFPVPLDSYVAIPSNVIYHVLLRTRLCPSMERQSEIISPSSFALNIPGLTDTEPDRHRRIALKALNERLLISNANSVAWPSLDDVGNAETANSTTRTSTSIPSNAAGKPTILPSTARSNSTPVTYNAVLVNLDQLSTENKNLSAQPSTTEESINQTEC